MKSSTLSLSFRPTSTNFSMKNMRRYQLGIVMVLLVYSVGATKTITATEPWNIRQLGQQLRGQASHGATMRRESLTGNIFQNDQGVSAFTTRASCQLNSAGFFGSPIGNYYQVNYFYQARVTPGTPLTTVNLEVLPFLNRAVPEGILPAFFDCSTGTGITSDNGAVVNAVSSQPTDEVVLQGLNCTGADQTDCYVFSGKLTIFANNLADEAAANALMIPRIQLLMQGTSLDDASESIVEVQYLDPSLSTIEPLPTVAPTPPPVVSPPVSTPRPTIRSTPRPTPRQTTGSTPAPTPPGTSIAPTAGGGATARPTPKVTTARPVPPPVSTTTSAPIVAPPVLTPAPVTNRPAPTAVPIATSQNVSTTAPVVAKPPTPSPQVLPAPSPPNITTNAPTTKGNPLPAPPKSSSKKTGLAWWAWLLIGAGAALVLFCLNAVCRGGGGAGRRRNPHAKSTGGQQNDDQNSYQPPQADDYIPPGMGMSPMSEQRREKDEEEEDDGEEFDEGEDDEEGDDDMQDGDGEEFDDEGDEEGEEGEEEEGDEHDYDDGEDEDHFDQGPDMFQNEGEGEEYEEDGSYYEEVTIEGSQGPPPPPRPQQQWSGQFQGRSGGSF